MSLHDPRLAFNHSASDEFQPQLSFSGPTFSNNDYDTPAGRSDSVPSPRKEPLSAAERARRKLNAKLASPLAGLSHAVLRSRGRKYAEKHQIGDEEDIRAFELGAVLAQDPEQYASVDGLTKEELEVLKREFTNKWSQPKLMYLVIILCSVCAAVQGMGMFLVSLFPWWMMINI